MASTRLSLAPRCFMMSVCSVHFVSCSLLFVCGDSSTQVVCQTLQQPPTCLTVCHSCLNYSQKCGLQLMQAKTLMRHLQTSVQRLQARSCCPHRMRVYSVT